MQFPKLTIISDGTDVAVLLDGVFFGRGVSGISFEKKETSAPMLSIDSIDTEAFKTNGPEKFEEVWESFLQGGSQEEGERVEIYYRV